MWDHNEDKGASFQDYSKTCVQWQLSKRQKNCFQYQLSFNAGHKYLQILQY